MPTLKNAKHEAYAQGLAQGLSADDAYAKAGFKPNRGNASRLKSNENIHSRVAELLDKSGARAEVTIARVLDEMRKLGFSDLRNAFDENGNLLPPSEWSDDFAASVSSIKVVTKTLPGQSDEGQEPQGHGGTLTRRSANVEYVHEIKVWDKNSALEKLAKHLGMFIEKVEHTGKDGGPIEVKGASDLTDDQLAAIAVTGSKGASLAKGGKT